MPWKWIWPEVGPTPINQGLDSEMFDRVDYPYSETFVREAIQNSLDARVDQSKPVVIRFSFHEDAVGKRQRFLEGAMTCRATAGLPMPKGWPNKIRWITVEDSNTSGLLGGLKDRVGDFWNYWLNFGLSNKTATGRGGRGIGRVTFLIASKIHTVIGITRRQTDNEVAASGMSVLKAGMHHGEFKSTHAYLAAEIDGPVYALHNAVDFHSSLEEAFKLEGYTNSARSGLALIIPYPYEELDEDGILAAAIDHFAPAILNGSLVIEVGVETVDASTIFKLAPFVAKHMTSTNVREGVERYLSMIALGQKPAVLKIELPSAKARLSDLADTDEVLKIRSAMDAGKPIAFDLRFPMNKQGKTCQVGLVAVVAQTPYGKPPVDRLFREGMSLPDVRARRPAEIDVVLLVEDEMLAQYLNLCEGKAHLDLLESKEVREKLEAKGFADGISVKRLVKALPDDIRLFIAPESDKPDTTVLDSFFAISDPENGKPKPKGKDKKEPLPPPPPPPPPHPSAVIVEPLPNGFRLRANQNYDRFPASVDIRIAYADGSSKPAWSEFDFRPKDLSKQFTDCGGEFKDNRLILDAWKANSVAEVTGFDTRRELDVRIRATGNASTD